ncbi:MAG TPA: sigma 54-interacting transcriptional regulator [bacterium]|nr:sigma 54-interacting transcriptional regulator [bacterium]
MDPVLTRIFQEVRTIYAPADFPVVVQGETGTGKEGVARAIHWHSPRRNKPFVAVNCGAIPEGLIDSEFFGHERGAFSGAINQRKGHFEVANGGTLFLDEIGEMPLGLQSRLLRVLQEGEVVRVGSSRAIPVDVRVVAATNRDLKELVDAKKFRADLFFRISASTLCVPPLRDRRDDIVMLTRYFFDKLKVNARHFRLQPIALKALLSYEWPGNVRQLQSCVQVASARVSASSRKTISVRDFQFIDEQFDPSFRRKSGQAIEAQLTEYKKKKPNASIMDTALELGLDYYFTRRLIKKLDL